MKPWCSTVVLSDKNVLFFLRRPVTGVRWSPAPCCCGPASCTCSGGPGSCTCYSSSPPPPRPDRPPSSSPQEWPPNGSLVLQMGLWSSKRLIGPPNGSLVLQKGHWFSKWVIGPPNGSLVLQMGHWSSKWVVDPPNGSLVLQMVSHIIGPPKESSHVAFMEPLTLPSISLHAASLHPFYSLQYTLQP